MRRLMFFVVLLLLASGIGFAASGSENELLKAVSDSDVQNVRALLERGVSANARYKSGNNATEPTILLISVSRDIVIAKMNEHASRGSKGYGRDIEIVNLLLDHGADVNAKEKSSGLTALMQAVIRGQYEMAKILLERGADVDAKAADGETALALALRTTREDAHPDVPSRIQMADLLVRNGANVNVADNNGWTPLMIAITERELPDEGTTRLELARFLIKSGADVNVSGKYGETPLMLAANYDEPEVVTALLGAGARVDSKDVNGFTALIAAAGGGSAESVSNLIRKGADVHVKTGNGYTALRSAREWYEASLKDPDCGTSSGCDKPRKKARYSKIVRALKKAGAKE